MTIKDLQVRASGLIEDVEEIIDKRERIKDTDDLDEALSAIADAMDEMKYILDVNNDSYLDAVRKAKQMHDRILWFPDLSLQKRECLAVLLDEYAEAIERATVLERRV